MKRIALLTGIFALLLTFGLAAPASAAGGYIGTGIGYAFPNFDLDEGLDIDEQGGFSWEIIHGGYNFTDNLGVSLVWGGATGTGNIVTPVGKENMDYSIGYIDLNFRFTYPMEKFSPYGEVGVGNYAFVGAIDEGDITSNEANLGYRAAVGAMVPVGKFYIAPEFAYNWVDMGGIDFDGHDTGSDLGNTNFGLLLVKFGYAFGGK